MSIPNVQPIDFPALVKRLHAEGAFAAYPKRDNGEFDELNQRSGSFRIKHPRRPGDGAFSTQSLSSLLSSRLMQDKVDLPQSVIHENRESFSDEFRLQFPAELHGQWMHQFFSGDFLSSRSMMQVVMQTPGTNIFFDDNANHFLDDRFSFKLNAPERRANDMPLFTLREIKEVTRYLARTPTLPLSIYAYQAAFSEYWVQFRHAVQDSDIPEPEKADILHVLQETVEMGNESPNYTLTLTPAIALAHMDRLRQHPGSDQELTREDFNEGMRFVIRNGGFRRSMQTASKETRNMSCSAQQTLTHMAEIDPNTVKEEAEEGAGLHHIFCAVKEALSHNPSRSRHLLGEMHSYIGSAAGMGEAPGFQL